VQVGGAPLSDVSTHHVLSAVAASASSALMASVLPSRPIIRRSIVTPGGAVNSPAPAMLLVEITTSKNCSPTQ